MSDKRRSFCIVLSMVIIVLLLACNSLTEEPTPTPEPPTPTETEIPLDQCTEARSPTDADVEYTLAFVDKVLIPDDWQRTYEVGTDRVNAVYHGPEGGFVASETLIYPCGYTSETIDRYFSHESLEQVIYANYQNPRVERDCRNDLEQLRLFEISAESQGTAYAIRHWVLNDHPTRVFNILIAYPEEDRENLDKLGEQLFPQLISCSD